MKTETIEWIDPAEHLPDADLEVICDTPEFGPVAGFLDGDQWRDITAVPIAVVTAWAHFPRGAHL